MQLNWREQFQKMFQLHLPEGPGKIKAGLYPFRREEGGNVTRFHLRVDPDGSGMLLANSSLAVRLSTAGVAMAKALLEGVEEREIGPKIRKNFRDAGHEQVKSDLARLNQFICTLTNPEDNYPIFNLDDPALTTPAHLFAPFHAQMSVASPDAINPLLAKLWESGILHVTFAATAASSADDVVANIERAEDIGMISGLRGPASWLQSADLLDRTATAGVDYIVAPVVASQTAEHDSIFGQGDLHRVMDCFTGCKKWEICPVAEIPLLKINTEHLPALQEWLQGQGVRNFLYYAVASEHQTSGLNGTQIIQAALDVEELAHHSQVRYVWLAPVSAQGDLRAVLESGPRSAGDVSIRVEPDGSVIPARGPKVAAGNLFSQNWDRIWAHEVFGRYRERIETPTHCSICPGLAICAADCPGDPQGWAK